MPEKLSERALRQALPDPEWFPQHLVRMKLSKGKQGTFADRRRNLLLSWDRAERRGKPRDDGQKTWQLLSLELEFSGKPLAELENVAWHALEWFRTKNPYHVDAALICCRNAGVDPPPTLVDLVADVALIRMQGLEQAGTAKSIRDSSILSYALRLICGLHLSGASVALAASKAARHISDQGYGKTYKASTLEREYSRAFRSGTPSLEDELRDARSRASEDQKLQWQRFLAELPEADDELKGNAR